MPRMVLTTSVASASPSTSSAIDEQRTARLRHALEQRQHLADVRDLLVVEQDERVLELGRLVLLVVDEVRREIAAVELHALDHFELVLQARALLDRDHAFLADLLHRIGDDLADRLVGVGRDRADLRDRLADPCTASRASSAPRRRRRRALSMPRLMSIGLMPAATDFRPSRMIACASTVAVVVPSPASSEVLDATSFTICAPMFSNLSFELDFLRDRHAVLGDGGSAEALLEHDVAALGAERRPSPRSRGCSRRWNMR